MGGCLTIRIMARLSFTSPAGSHGWPLIDGSHWTNETEMDVLTYSWDFIQCLTGIQNWIYDVNNVKIEPQIIHRDK